MKPFRPLLAAATAAGLLVAGCDYWQNLVDDKTVTHADLRITVLDTWTKQPLSDAICKDAVRGLEWTTDANGRITVANAETGHYRVSCTSPSYYDGTIEFPLTRSRSADTVPMARRGGADWYPDDEARQVGIVNTKPYDPFQQLRFPSPTGILASPADSQSRFVYLWKFSKAVRLNRGDSSTKLNSPLFDKPVSTQDVEDRAEDTLTLTVKSRLNGKANEYVVGTYQRVFLWVRNNLPILYDIEHERAELTVGCPDPITKPLQVNFSAIDIDGDCPEVRFWSADHATSLGNLNMTLTCSAKRLVYPLKNTFSTLRTDSALYMDNKLYISATDANGGQTLDSIEFKTKTNIQPTIKAFIEGSPQVVFAGEEILVHFEASDSSEPVSLVTTNWGNGETSINYKEKNQPTLRDTIPHIYGKNEIGSKTVTVRIEDGCNAEAIVDAGSFNVLINTAPEIESFSHFSKDFQNDSTNHTFSLGIRDKELSMNLDSITQVKINWGDDTPTLDYAEKFKSAPYNALISHIFKKPPTTPSGYEITISVKDSHSEVGVWKTTMSLP